MKKWVSKSIQRVAWGLVGLSVVMVVYLLIKAAIYGYTIGAGEINFEATGQVGDFIGGFVGTIISAAGFLFLYLTLKEQRNATKDQRRAFEKERFENRFFELLKLYRDNVSAMSIELTDETTTQITKIEGNKAMKFIYHQIMEARDEIKPFFRKIDEHEIYEAEYHKTLKGEYTILNRDISLKEIAKMNIAYHIVFFGVDYYGKHIILNALSGKYKRNLIVEIIDYMALKPYHETANWNFWTRIRKMELSQKKHSVKNIYWKRETQSKASDVTLSNVDENDSDQIFYRDNFVKYYGGHQLRLGHYFRHMYQTVNYVNDIKLFTYVEKYEYIKMLRAQMSTYEQIVFYFNSLSSMGDIWELCLSKRFDASMSQPTEIELLNKQLVTKYNLIKNLANGQLLKQSFTRNYPDIAYEFQTTPAGRKDLENKYL